MDFEKYYPLYYWTGSTESMHTDRNSTRSAMSETRHPVENCGSKWQGEYLNWYFFDTV